MHRVQSGRLAHPTPNKATWWPSGESCSLGEPNDWVVSSRCNKLVLRVERAFADQVKLPMKQFELSSIGVRPADDASTTRQLQVHHCMDGYP